MHTVLCVVVFSFSQQHSLMPFHFSVTSETSNFIPCCPWLHLLMWRLQEAAVICVWRRVNERHDIMASVCVQLTDWQREISILSETEINVMLKLINRVYSLAALDFWVYTGSSLTLTCMRYLCDWQWFILISVNKVF